MQTLVSFILVLALSLQGLFSTGSKPSGPDNPDGQVTHSLTTTYALDQASGLPQVLADGTYTYFYGLDRLAQQGTNQTEYFLPDALGSVRQMTGTNGYVTTSQSFDPFGSLSEQISADSVFGYAGEQTDATALEYLRARYYAPGQGRFLSQDPFPGLLSNPSTLNAYAYVNNDPILMSDPSGQIVPFLVAAGVGGLIGAGMNVFSQLHQMHPQSLEQALRCLDWGQVGISFAAGAVAGLVGFTIFGGMSAWLGTGLWANIASGAVAGAISGQYARLTDLVLSGHADQIGSSLFRWQDLAFDAALGGLGGALSYGIQRGLSGIAHDILQRVTDSANRRLGANPGLAQGVLRRAEYLVGQANPSVARMHYGNAVERMVARQIGRNPFLSAVFEHVGGPNNPDFIGKGIFNGLNLDITTNSSRSIASHLSRAYGQGLIIATYSRPIGFGVFP